MTEAHDEIVAQLNQIQDKIFRLETQRMQYYRTRMQDIADAMAIMTDDTSEALMSEYRSIDPSIYQIEEELCQLQEQKRRLLSQLRKPKDWLWMSPMLGSGV